MKNVVMQLCLLKTLLQFNQHQKSDKASATTYADLECINKETDGCKNNPENSSATEVS